MRSIIEVRVVIKFSLQIPPSFGNTVLIGGLLTGGLGLAWALGSLLVLGSRLI